VSLRTQLARARPFLVLEGAYITHQGVSIRREGTYITREGVSIRREGAYITREGASIRLEGAYATREGASIPREGRDAIPEGRARRAGGGPAPDEGGMGFREGPMRPTRGAKKILRPGGAAVEQPGVATPGTNAHLKVPKPRQGRQNGPEGRWIQAGMPLQQSLAKP
jgi:hypothetical protein